jgi:WD40 repeat protein
VVNANEPLSEALADMGAQLDAEGPFGFDPQDAADRAKALARTIDVSLELLSETERLRLGELGVFPEDTEIPVGVVVRLWTVEGSLKEYQTKALRTRLFDLSLLLDLDLGQRFFRLHDTTRHFLQDRAGKDGLVAQHRKLVAALDGAKNAETEKRTKRYYYLYLPYHLAEAGEGERLSVLLLDPSWLEAKLESTGDPLALVGDYQRYGRGEALRLIGRGLQLISGICARDGRQLLPQLIGRLAGSEPVAASGFLESARRIVRRPAIIPLRPLAASGAERARLEGHTDFPYALCVLPDGRLASGSPDETIRLWDVTWGKETARLEVHNGADHLCLLSDGRLASSNYSDGTIRLWDVATGAETARLEGHSKGVYALCLLRDGRLASSGSSDGTIRLWDATTGAETARLEGHSSFVNALCVLPDGRLASGSSDKTIRLWDVTAGAETACLQELDCVWAMCVLSDGRLASGANDGTISLWNVATGAETARLEGHTNSIKALCVLPDARLVSGSEDKTIRLWDVMARVETGRLEGHLDYVFALCLLPDGRLASGSRDLSIRLWDIAAGADAARLESVTDAITALCLLPGERLALGYEKGTIRLRDLATGAETAHLRHGPPVTALCLLADGRLASGFS